MQQTAKLLSSMLEGDTSLVAPEKQASTPVSYGYSSINLTDVTPAMTNAWKDDSIPEKQRELVEQELKQMYSGKVLPHYKALADILQPVLTPDASLLEIGCASGYYLEILQHLLKQKINYTGVDYSDPLISMAKRFYPQGKFFVADGANLFFSNRKFDVVISSCVLLHVPNYREHIFESVRVADQYVVAHRTPVCRQRPTQYFKKFAYGVETVELLFNEDEILREFTTNGLTLINQIEYFSDPAQDLYLVTYLFKRS
jgi:2-polyprenyl-3-methyl-5-hydroxy-6-metoxy-1,4-benzoquinol methylase